MDHTHATLLQIIDKFEFGFIYALRLNNLAEIEPPLSPSLECRRMMDAEKRGTSVHQECSACFSDPLYALGL